MNKHTRGFLSAVVSAALCISSVPLQTVNADIIIDHNCSGIDKGYYFEIANNDQNNQPEFILEPGGNYTCSWDNDDDFTASRGVKFASPADYKTLGEISYKYWKRLDIESLSGKENSYVRFGIRIHNSNGDIFDILEIDTSADGSSITEKDEKYIKIGSLDSKEVLHDYSIFGPTAGESFDVAYSIYVRENDDNTKSFVCRRDEPMSVNNDIEDERRININDKLDAIAATGNVIGEITDIGLFLESAHSKGKATIYTYDLSVEKMPVLAPDEYEDADAPLTVKGYDYGERTGFYYAINSRFENDKMEVTAPSSFKAEWDSRENKYNNDPTFERGIKYEPKQSYKAISGSSIDYTMNFDAEGSFAVSTAAKFGVMEMPDYFLSTEVYIVDACSKDWTPSEYAEKIGEFSTEDIDYDVYDGSINMIGTGKSRLTHKYYFISKNAAKAGKEGTVTAKHDLGPYMEYVHDMGVVLGNADVLTAQVNGGISKGSAELVSFDITAPFYVPDDGEYERETRKIELNYLNNPVFLNGLCYGINGSNMVMKGYAGEKINYEWKEYQAPAFSSNDTEYYRSFDIGMQDIRKNDLSFGCEDNESLLFDYNIDIGEINSVKKDPKWVLGGHISCINPDYLTSEGTVDDYYGCELLIADTWDGEPTSEFTHGAFRDPQELGTIVSNGVKYDVIAYIPEVMKDNSTFVIVKRQKQRGGVDAENGCTRYEGSFDAADIVRKVSSLGINTYDIQNAYFSLIVLRSTGSAAVNSISVKKEKTIIPVYTADDIKELTDFLLGADPEIDKGTNYDLNEDGIWDVYDLCMMRKMIADNNANEYLEPDVRVPFAVTYNVVSSGAVLYRGPSESYEVISSIPVGAQINELGYQNDDDKWFFAQYNGLYGWVMLNDSIQQFFNTNNQSAFAWGKPVIYLYPEEETDVHVELELTTSDLYTTYPKYNNGWDVVAYPDGSLLNKADGTHHKYLFWESVNSRTNFDYSKGFCVAGSDTESFLKEKLTYMGLTEEEMNEFIVYWLPKLEHNAYNFICFQGDIYTDSAKLDITPKPDSLLRIFMTYIPLEEAFDVEPQQLETFERKGFTVVEWGGTEINAKKVN